MGAAVFALVSSSLVMSPAAYGVDPCNPVVNPIVCENSKPGTPDSDWDIQGAGDPTIQGFATDISVNVGQTVNFKIKSANAFTIQIYRLGYYNGNGARLQGTATPIAGVSNNQPACVDDAAGTQIYDCGTWGVSASWAVPANAVSGVYFAKLTRTDPSEGASHITFIVRNDASTSDVFFQTSDTTWQAYNTYGGSDFYTGGAHGRAYKLSYNRPFATRGNNTGHDFLFSNEYPMIRFLERNGYDVSYTTGIDSDRRGNLIQNHKLFMSTGHDEYWSGTQRANVEAARDAGVHLAFFSGNSVYWKTRWESSQDGANTAYRTLVCYKETWANQKLDTTSNEWTGTWRDPRFSPPSNGGRPENALLGTAYMANFDDLPITVSSDEGKLRIWRNAGLNNQPAGTSTALAPHTVGYESDEDLDNGFRPAGLIRMSTTVGETPQYLRDFGNTVTPGITNHHITMYKANSGALVFSAGTIQWAWGLGEDHDGINSPGDPRMQQATINILSDMDAQPDTPMAGMVITGASTDTQAPTATITSPANGTSVVNGSQVTVQGTASDLGGGRVAGIEVSTDGGTTWHPATSGTTSWTYSFYTNGPGTQDILARATDDSANRGAPSTPRSLTLTGSSTLFGQRVPANPSINETSALELGVRFMPQTNGFITGVRFYKGTGNTGTHTGSLWSNTGTRLATGTFTGESSTGWQTLTFSTPVAVAANTKYVASYFAPNGGYANDPWAFSAADLLVSPLTVTRSISNAGNGLFKYGGGFPNGSYKDTNYYVDVQFTAAANAAPFVMSTTPEDGASGVAISAQPTAVFSKSLNPASIVFSLTKTGGVNVPGTVAYNDSTKTVTFTPSASLAAAENFTASVQASDLQGNAMTAPTTWTFATDLDPSVSKLFATSAVPSVPSVNDGNSVELGVKFTPSVNGTVIGVRYYQGAGNSGTHVGSLWTASGTLLGRATFAPSGGTGWQSVLFSTPVNVSAGFTYVASYFAPAGHYSANSNFFTSTWTNGPLSAPAGNNGTYKYGANPVFPNSSYNSTNYWVDPLFMAGTGGSTTISLYNPADSPTVANYNDNFGIELGMQFRSDVAGQITAVKFYKGPLNTGTHTGSLWTAAGALLATGTYTNETASGWQTLTFTTPVQISANTDYVVSYYAPIGKYAVNVNAFLGGGLDSGVLHAPAGAARYRYTGATAFPNSSSNHSYWVDVVFQPGS